MIQQPDSKLWRVPFVQRCRVESGGSTREAVCCNISADGVYVVVHPIPPVGERVRLHFELPGNELPIVVDAEVCWAQMAGGSSWMRCWSSATTSQSAEKTRMLWSNGSPARTVAAWSARASRISRSSWVKLGPRVRLST